MALAEKVKRLRNKRGMSQSELADAADLTQATISRIESGQVSELRSDALMRLAVSLKVTMDFLSGRTERFTSYDLFRTDPDAEYVLELYKELSPRSREGLKEYAQYLLLSERVDMDQLDELRRLVADQVDAGDIDRQVELLRALASLTSGGGDDE